MHVIIQFIILYFKFYNLLFSNHSLLFLNLICKKYILFVPHFNFYMLREFTA